MHSSLLLLLLSLLFFLHVLYLACNHYIELTEHASKWQIPKSDWIGHRICFAPSYVQTARNHNFIECILMLRAYHFKGVKVTVKLYEIFMQLYWFYWFFFLTIVISASFVTCCMSDNTADFLCQ